jgi:hypothetical protein
MPFQLSPGVNVSEIDLTGIVPAVASSDGAIAGVFNWGPIGTRQLIDTESKLVSIFGKPTSNNAETWFTAANFLSYGNRLYVTRVANTTNNGVGTLSAVAYEGSVADLSSVVVKNNNDYETKDFTEEPDVYFVARYPGAVGNSLKISICDNADGFSKVLYMNGLEDPSQVVDVVANLSISVGSSSGLLLVLPGGGGTAGDANDYATYLATFITPGDSLLVGNGSIGTQSLHISSLGEYVANSTGGFLPINFDATYRLSTDFSTSDTVNSTISRIWHNSTYVENAPTTSDYQAQFGDAAVADTMHIVITDEKGLFTGVPGTVLEVYNGVSRATDAKTVGGAVNYWKQVINQTSKYIWVANDFPGVNSAKSADLAASDNTSTISYQFTDGQDGVSESAISLGTVAAGYDLYKSAEDVDVSLILQGKPIGSGGTYQLANYIIDNICETRKDCIVLVSPDDSVVITNAGNEALKLVEWRNSLHDSSYAVLDSGYKYQYDRYNDVYRYIPANGDVAGLCARTDSVRDPWWSPAGFNRGQLKNLVKLRWNPKQADRDILYKNGINPLVSFPGQGTVLYGDKTLQSKPSAFDRINVRRLFIVLEKAIATASKFFLFEFNDEFTRAQFKSLVTPYLRDIQGRRGITDFLVVCDGTNNTGERIDRNEFWGDIYIKPARSINFIQLNFVAVRTGVQFSEIVGKF